MTSADGKWRTFCHISEYDADGYTNLRRMIATSNPLVVWAPSSQLLRSSASSITPSDFLAFVESGDVRVAARENWLTDRSFRDSHPWQGARWDEQIDGTLEAIYRNDLGEQDETRRRVVVAPEERGRERATQHMKKHPEVVAELVEDLHSPRASQLIPPGSLQHARAHARDDRSAVRLILRDVINHGQAIADTSCDTAILLGRADGAFLRHLVAIHSRLTQGQTLAARDAEKNLASYTELSAALVELLRDLEWMGRKSDFHEFMKRPERQELISWTRRVADRMRYVEPTAVRRELRRALLTDLSGSRFTTLMGGLVDRAATGGGLAVGVLSVLAGVDALAVAGLGVSALPVGKAVLQQFGFVSRDFAGPQWPFRYAHGAQARPDQVKRLKELLASEA